MSEKSASAFLEYGLTRIKVHAGRSVQETFNKHASKMDYMRDIEIEPIYKKISSPGKIAIIGPEEIIVPNCTYVLTYNFEVKGST